MPIMKKFCLEGHTSIENENYENSALKRFAATTSAHGYSRVIEAKSRRTMILWLSLLLFSVIGFFSHSVANLVM